MGDEMELESSSSEKWQLTAMQEEDDTERQDQLGMHLGDYVSLETTFSSLNSNSGKYSLAFFLLSIRNSSFICAKKWSFERIKKKELNHLSLN